MSARAHSLGPGSVGRGLLRHHTIAHARAQARVRNVDMKYNHVYYTALYNAVYEKNGTK